ncbi:hypothetical protein BLA29_007048, partial [Euroglyphus maynei]
MLRHKSTPCLLQLAKSTETLTNQIYYNDDEHYHRGNDLQDRYHNLQEQHQQLKRETNDAREQIRKLNTRMSRLLMEKKRLLKNVKSEHEIMKEEQLFELEQELRRQQQQNERLRERLKLMHHTTIDDRPKSSSLTTKLIRTTSAYSNVRSRTDSGLGFYFRPLNLSQSSTTSRRRSRSQTNRSVKFQEPPAEEISTDENLTLKTAIILIQEAKAEIIRLESIIEQQQRVIDSFRQNNLPISKENGSKVDESLLSMMIMTTTTTTRTTTTTKNSSNVTSSSNGDQTIDSLWLKYQQIMNNKESFQRISLECQQLFERLYSAMKLERQKSDQYRTKLQQQEMKMA